MDKLAGGLHYLSNIIGDNTCSLGIMPDLSKAIGSIRGNMLHKKPSRQKRNIELVSAMGGAGNNGVSESIAGTLLVAYDLLVSKNQNVVTVYLSNLVDLLSQFCVQTDSTRTMIGNGQNITTIQLQGLIPSYKSFLTNVYSLAGTSSKTVSFLLISSG